MKNRSLLISALVVIAAGASVVAPMANAADDPTPRELLEQCNNGTDSCVFHPKSRTQFAGARKQVAGPVYNCTSIPQGKAVAWADSTGGSNSLGITISAEYKWSEVFTTSVSTTYEHTWNWSHTVTRTDTLNTPPSQVGRIYHAPLMQTVVGDFELHFGKKFRGHYYWYVNNFSATGPSDTEDPTAVVFDAEPMTSAEKDQNC